MSRIDETDWIFEDGIYNEEDFDDHDEEGKIEDHEEDRILR